MSGVYINMEMPQVCDDCWALDEYGDYPRCRITNEQRGYNFRTRERKMDKCPLIPVPDHGRLIDVDKITRFGGRGGLIHSKDVDNATTIIPADKDGEA